jgi:uncharacterized beta-barrel protein YwiB (DUF1934 family)
MKRAVSIQLHHRSESDAFSQTFQGLFFDVPPLGYLRYRETDDQIGDTQTTIRLLPDELRIQRRGTIETLMVLKPNERTSVVYQLAGAQMKMTAYTSRLDFYWSHGEGNIDCFYELWLDDQKFEQIHLELIVKSI